MNKALHQVYVTELKLLHNRESQLIDAIPDMTEMATDDSLEGALDKHLQETKEQKERLEKILEGRGEDAPGGKTCGTMETLLSEGEQLAGSVTSDNDVRDSVIIAGARKVEHFEMASYQTVIEWADVMGYDGDKSTLKNSLSEEDAAASTLAGIAQGGLISTGVSEEAAA